jgi:hypothetical protein
MRISGIHRVLLGATVALMGVAALAPNGLASTRAGRRSLFGVCHNGRGATTSRLLSTVAEAPSAEAATEETTANIR